MIENMEGAGFFQTCLNHGVNFMEIRVISNIVGSAINPQVSENLYQAIVKLLNDLSKNEH
jgi:nucleoside phosphorylase